MTQHITLPNTWTPPKYHFGQLVKQGEIVGMEYYAPGTDRASRHGEGWIYWVVVSPSSDDAETFGEQSISPLTPEELHTLITDEIKQSAQRIAVLKGQLERAGE